jgi:serine phosphatase RsbU (regulator of sigma subunit)
MRIVKYITDLQILLTILFLLVPLSLFPQSTLLDSLASILDLMEEDTAKVNALNEMALSIHRTHPEMTIQLGQEALALAESLNFQKGLAQAYKNIGLGNYMNSDYTEATRSWESSLQIYTEIGDTRGMANLVSNLAAIYNTMDLNEKAAEYNLRALKMAEEVKDSTRIATILLNIGVVYSKQPATLSDAKEYYLRSLEIGESLEYRDLLSVGDYNLGEVYYKQEVYDSAVFYFQKAIDQAVRKEDIAAARNYIGRTYMARGNYDKAIAYQKEALAMLSDEGDGLSKVLILEGLATTYTKIEDLSRAIDYFEQARRMAEKIGLKEELSQIYGGLSFSFAELKNYHQAYRFLALQQEIDNAIYRMETEKRTNKLMFSYELDKKDSEIEILEQRSEIEQWKNRRQRTTIAAVGAIGGLLLLLAIGLFNRMRYVRATNKRINEQKAEIEVQRDKIQKQRDMVYLQNNLITDSINYAQRIQLALLPSQELLQELMPTDFFILFKPKDIVSGDFFWVKEVQDHLVIVSADCTGHGVPGAFMSMLGITLLNGMVGDRCFDAPGAMLDRLRVKIKELLVQEGKQDEQKDGMDMAVVILNKKTREMHTSGANNPVYILRSNQNPADRNLEPFLSLEQDRYQLFEIRGDKQPIGTYWEETPFTSRSFRLQKNDSVYLFSDGYVDQYGGEQRKKFKALNFKKLLLSIQMEPMKTQKERLESTFETWRGEIEQIDDVSILGFRV